MSFCDAAASPARGKALARALCLPRHSSPQFTPALRWEGEQSKREAGRRGPQHPWEQIDGVGEQHGSLHQGFPSSPSCLSRHLM